MARTRAVCVYCRTRPQDPEWRPFCSERCKLQDLAQWVDGTYRVAGERQGEADDSNNEKGQS